MAIFIRAEVASRELVPRLLLGMVCAEAGYDVVVGKLKIKGLLAGRIGPARFSPGLLHLKSPAVTPPLYPLYADLKRDGYALSAQDEEAGTSEAVDATAFFALRAPLRAYEQLDVYLCWGERDRVGLTQKYPTMESRLRRTGSPRIDLFRPVMQNCARPGFSDGETPYTLWASSTSPLGKFSALQAKQDYLSQWSHRDVEDFWHEWISTVPLRTVPEELLAISEDYKLLAEAVESIESLAAAVPSMRVVVRPHQHEDPTAWQHLIKHVSNATVRSGGEISDWIAGASLVIHTMSTVGLQAQLLGVPVLNYTGKRKGVPEMSLSGKQCQSPSSLVEEAARVIATQNNLDIHEQTPLGLVKHFDGLEGALASERILGVWEDLFGSELLGRAVRLQTNARRSLRSGKAQSPLGGTLPVDVTSSSRHDFPALDSSDWQRLSAYLVNRFQRFSDVKVTPLGPFDVLLRR